MNRLELNTKVKDLFDDDTLTALVSCQFDIVV
jgi:hypothetical protein